MPECFRKLCASFPVSSWTQDVQEGVKHMALIFVDVCTAYFRVGLAPDSVLSILSIVSSMECYGMKLMKMLMSLRFSLPFLIICSSWLS